MFGDLKLELGRNFKNPHMLGVFIHLKSPKSKTSTKNFEFKITKAKF
jgi:hypothetical protein